jgi:hypothetical protein
VVEAARPVSVNERLVVVATCGMVLVVVPRWMEYKEIVAPLFGVLAVHERERVETVGVPTERLPGAVGAVATAIDVVAVDVPFAFVAARVYTVVDVGFTVKDPIRVLVEKLPGVMTTEEAFVMFQLKVLVPAEATIEGDAEKEEMAGTPFVCAPPSVSNVPGADPLLYSVAIQSGERATLAR